MINLLTIVFENGSPIPHDWAVNSKYLFWYIPAYPFFMFTGVCAAIIAGIIKFNLKKIPMRELQISIWIIIPFGILGGTIFGKVDTSESFNWKIWELLYFWEPGMNLFGALICGGTAGFVWFYISGRTKMISMWVYADCILPNILIGQAIGRWGNLYNHEILGRPVDANSVNWLPDFIWHRLFYVVNPEGGLIDKIQFREPLFLYESIATFSAWLLLMFVFPNIGRWFSKKPWKNDSQNFPCVYNKKNKWAELSTLKIEKYQESIKYKEKNNKVSLSLWQVWNKAYYLKEIDSDLLHSVSKKFDKNTSDKSLKTRRISMLKDKIDDEIEIEKTKLRKNKIDKKSFLLNKNIIIKKYKEELRQLYKSTNDFKSWLKRDSSDLYKLHNPKNYFIIHCGYLAGIYLTFYTIIRMIIESHRNIGELSIKWSWVADYIWLSILLIFSILIMVFAQFIAPKKWREEGWLYEKSY